MWDESVSCFAAWNVPYSKILSIFTFDSRVCLFFDTASLSHMQTVLEGRGGNQNPTQKIVLKFAFPEIKC